MPRENNETTTDAATAGRVGALSANQEFLGRRKLRGIQRILFHHGWWFVDLWSDRLVRLDPLFAACGWNVGKLLQYFESRALGACGANGGRFVLDYFINQKHFWGYEGCELIFAPLQA